LLSECSKAPAARSSPAQNRRKQGICRRVRAALAGPRVAANPVRGCSPKGPLAIFRQTTPNRLAVAPGVRAVQDVGVHGFPRVRSWIERVPRRGRCSPRNEALYARTPGEAREAPSPRVGGVRQVFRGGGGPSVLAIRQPLAMTKRGHRSSAAGSRPERDSRTGPRSVPDASRSRVELECDSTQRRNFSAAAPLGASPPLGTSHPCVARERGVLLVSGQISQAAPRHVAVDQSIPRQAAGADAPAARGFILSRVVAMSAW